MSVSPTLLFAAGLFHIYSTQHFGLNNLPYVHEQALHKYHMYR